MSAIATLSDVRDALRAELPGAAEKLNVRFTSRHGLVTGSGIPAGYRAKADHEVRGYSEYTYKDPRTCEWRTLSSIYHRIPGGVLGSLMYADACLKADEVRLTVAELDALNACCDANLGNAGMQTTRAYWRQRCAWGQDAERFDGLS